MMLCISCSDSLMTSTESAASVQTSRVIHFYLVRPNTSRKMTQQDKPLADYRGRARGLMDILEEDRQR